MSNGQTQPAETFSDQISEQEYLWIKPNPTIKSISTNKQFSSTLNYVTNKNFSEFMRETKQANIVLYPQKQIDVWRLF